MKKSLVKACLLGVLALSATAAFPLESRFDGVPFPQCGPGGGNLPVCPK